MNRQGVILAGGTASRLGPLTRVLNKHLLPVGDKPMLLHGLEMMRNMDVRDVVIILGGNSVGDIVNLVQDGSEWGLNITYRYQTKPSGISDALYLAKDVLRPDKFVVLLGDNIFGSVINLDPWFKGHTREGAALVVTTSVKNPEEYGQPVYNLHRDPLAGNISSFVEKKRQIHNDIVTGLYGFDYDVFSIIRRQTYSERGEKEVTDTLNSYVPDIINYRYNDYWVDCGTHNGLLSANKYFFEKGDDK